MEIELRRAVGLLDYLGKQAWLKGEEIVITNKGKPYLKLVAHPDGDPSQAERKPLQTDSGAVDMRILPDFDEPDEDIMAAIDGPLLNEGDGTRGIGADANQTWVAPDLPETSEEIIEAFEGKWSNDFF